jgi:DNA-binding XRE family transcriptional regulator
MNETPFKSFGSKLKQLRMNAKETVVDVSGAVEADEKLIKEIEAGVMQPSEELVLLLISHFALKEEDALQLWDLAGFGQEKTGISNMSADQQGNIQKAYVTAGDVRIIYTDMVHIKANNHGVVINFLQNLGADDHTMAVSRVGMSHEHAKTLLKVLKQTLKATDPQKTSAKSKNAKESSK